MNKTCTVCKTVKPIIEFNLSRGRPRGECKLCHRAASALWQKQNRPMVREHHMAWRNRNREHVRSYARTYYKNKMTTGQKKIKSEKAKIRYISRKYGITQEQWDDLFRKQNGVCALCKIPGRTGRFGKLAVDHCHETGRIRGLLCASCNVSLGILGDTPDRIKSVLEYVTGKNTPAEAGVQL